MPLRFPRRAVLSLALIAAAGLSATHAASAPTTNSISMGSAPTSAGPLHPVSLGASFATVPYWTMPHGDGTFFFVGSNPATTHSPTTVPTEIIPLRVVFPDKFVLDSTTQAVETMISPIFRNNPYATGTTQYGNAILRASFWNEAKGTNWGTLLGMPRLMRPVTIQVPADKGFHAPAGTVQGGFLDYAWFFGVVQTTLQSLNLDPHTLPIVLGNDLAMYCNGNPADLCSLGYHYGYDLPHGEQTYIYATWVQPGVPVQVQDVMPLGHEIAEWLHDPFVSNTVDAWPLPQGGCSTILETGDPLVAENGESSLGNPVTFRVGPLTFHLQNEALVPYFTRQSPSSAFDGAYSFPDTSVLTAPAPSCP